jgi:DNA-binding cell septation regulator SpoVG
MIKRYCDICNSEKDVQETEDFLEQLKERLGEYGLYKTILSNLHSFGGERKIIKHICEDCREKIWKGIFDHYEKLFDSFFEEPKPKPSAIVDINEVSEYICKQLKLLGYGCKY